jgi:thiol-disulfide isomerase/thioredoxin
MMVERLLILFALAGALAGGWQLLRLWQARRVRALATERLFAGILPDGRPAVVAFTLPSCSDCRARQAPALERLRAQAPAVEIAVLRADGHGELIERLGILTVPSTVVLDARGGVRFLNQGFADEVRLAGQLAALP